MASISTPGGYVRPATFRPQPGEKGGLGTAGAIFFKSEAYGIWQQAEVLAKVAETTFNQYAPYMTDAARSEWSSKLINMGKAFGSEWRKVQGYSEGWTNWGKYIDQGLVWITQWGLFAAEVKETGIAGEAALAKKTDKLPKEPRPGLIRRRSSRVSTRAVLGKVKGNPVAAAIEIKTAGETAIPPTQADETLLWVGAAVLGAVLIWTAVTPEKK